MVASSHLWPSAPGAATSCATCRVLYTAGFLALRRQWHLSDAKHGNTYSVVETANGMRQDFRSHTPRQQHAAHQHDAQDSLQSGNSV
jgi:hypothetical protein